jgi:hypothetical protein
MCGPVYGPDCGPPSRARYSLGADAPLGRVGAHALAVLDGGFKGPDGALWIEDRAGEEADMRRRLLTHRSHTDGTTA